MPVKGIVALDEFEKLPEQARANYKLAKDGKVYELDIEAPEGYEFFHATALRTAFERAKGDVRTMAERLKAVEDLEKDPKTAREALAKWKDIEKWTPDEKVRQQIETHVKQVQEKFAETERGLVSERDRLKAGLDSALRISAAESAIRKAGGNPRLLLREVTDHLRLEEKNGKFVTYVVGPDGNPRITRKQAKEGEAVDSPMGLDELVEMYKKDPEFAPAFAGAGSGGAGTRPPGAAGSTSGHRISPSDAQDPSRYRAAKAAATKAGVELTIAD